MMCILVFLKKFSLATFKCLCCCISKIYGVIFNTFIPLVIYMVFNTAYESATPSKAYIYNSMVLVAKFINTCFLGDSFYGLSIIKPMPVICYSHSGGRLPSFYAKVNHNRTEQMLCITSPTEKP